jgi:hypothetical protein
VRALAVPNGPLDQFKHALEALQAKITDGGRLRKAGGTLMWKFRKEEVASILAQIERLKRLVGVALEMDHLEASVLVVHSSNAYSYVSLARQFTIYM